LQRALEKLGSPTAPPRTQPVANVVNMTKAYLQKLYANDVRHIIPIHTSDNVFGAAAVYDMRMTAANRLMTGHWFPERNAFDAGIRARPDLDVPMGNLPDFADKVARQFLGTLYQTALNERAAWMATYTSAMPQSAQKGFAHRDGLTDVGKAAV